MRLTSLTIMFGLCACDPAASQNLLSRVTRGTGVAEPSLRIPRGGAAARVCEGPDLPARQPIGEPVALYPARGVQSVTYDLPFVAAPASGRTECDLILQGRPLRTANGQGARFRYVSCDVLITHGASQRIVVAPAAGRANGKDRFALSECVYRVTMYVQGFKGALAEPTETLFQPRGNSIHVGKPWVGPRTTLVPWTIALRCPQLAKLYYGDDLARALKRSCPAAHKLLEG